MIKKIALFIIFSSLPINFISGKENPTPPPYLLLDDCDACGCSANGGSMGFNSLLNENFVGIRYIHQNYKSRDGVFNNSPWIEENFNTIQLWGRIPISKKVELMGLLPYHFNNREKPSGTQYNSGLGDITLAGFYTALHKEQENWGQKLQVGAGVKIPTGKYDAMNNGSINPSFQLGTGSWDYSLLAEYSLKFKNWGMNTNFNYIVKTENAKKYRFGNQLNYGGMLFYSAKIKDFSIVPQMGIAGEVYDANKDFGEKIPLTSGNILLGKMGAELGYKKISLGLNLMLPISQNLTGGRVKANHRFAVSLNYSL